MREIALHLLDIAENSAAAESKTISVHIQEDLFKDRLMVSVIDDGRGMDAETAQQVQDPFYTTRTTRTVGLGIPLLRLAAEQAEAEARAAAEHESELRRQAAAELARLTS